MRDLLEELGLLFTEVSLSRNRTAYGSVIERPRYGCTCPKPLVSEFVDASPRVDSNDPIESCHNVLQHRSFADPLEQLSIPLIGVVRFLDCALATPLLQIPLLHEVVHLLPRIYHCCAVNELTVQDGLGLWSHVRQETALQI